MKKWQLNSHTKFNLILLLAGAVLIFSAAFGFYRYQKPLKACTMEAKLCSDGSAVGRSGPNCDFAPCPK